MLSACKQSRRPHAPLILESMDVAKRVGSVEEGELLVALDPGGIELNDLLNNLQDTASLDRFCVMIGPEGGFSQGELEAIKAAGVRMVNLGPGILRIETAAIIACALAGQLARLTKG